MNVRVMLVREGRRRKVRIQSPQDVHRFMRKEARDLDRECFWRIDLNAANNAISRERVSVGTASAALVHCRELFRGAILSGPTVGIIVVHNHLSGDPHPSPEDKQTTRRLVEAGKLLGIPVVDHIILAGRKFFSFRDSGLLGGGGLI